MNKFLDITKIDPFGKRKTIQYDCPGCKCSHALPVDEKGWNFNDDYANPTLSPSVFVNKGMVNPSTPQCHHFIKNGFIQFLNDCSHELAGKTIELSQIDN